MLDIKITRDTCRQCPEYETCRLAQEDHIEGMEECQLENIPVNVHC